MSTYEEEAFRRMKEATVRSGGQGIYITLRVVWRVGGQGVRLRGGVPEATVGERETERDRERQRQRQRQRYGRSRGAQAFARIVKGHRKAGRLKPAARPGPARPGPAGRCAESA